MTVYTACMVHEYDDQLYSACNAFNEYSLCRNLSTVDLSFDP